MIAVMCVIQVLLPCANLLKILLVVGQHFQMPPQGPDGRQIIYQSMNMVSNDNHLQSSQQSTPHSQHVNQQMISQPDGYQTKANHYQSTNQVQHNTPELHSKFSHPIVHNNQPAMVTTLQPQNCAQPLGSGWQKPSGGFTHFPNSQLGYGNPSLTADTSMNWNYTQPGSQLMQTVGHQQFSIHCSPARSKKVWGSLTGNKSIHKHTVFCIIGSYH